MRFTEKTKNKIRSMMLKKISDLHPLGNPLGTDDDDITFLLYQMKYGMQMDKMSGGRYHQLHSKCNQSFYDFLDGLGIKVVANPEAERKNIYLKDPFLTGNFLKIPRDIAQKIVILGFLP